MDKKVFGLIWWGGILALTGVSLAALLTFESQFHESNRIEGTDLYVSTKTSDVYIVVERNGKKELHKGSIEQLKTLDHIGKHSYYNPTDLTRKVFYCGETTISNEKYDLYQIRPDESCYDHECEDCFE